MSKRTTRATGRPTTSAKSGRTRFLLLTAATVLAIGALQVWGFLDLKSPASAESSTVWQSPTHACCSRWVSYMRAKGYAVAVTYVDDMSMVKANLGIPERARSCHTAEISDYIIEGHVPAPAVVKLLDERPALKGIALPGMPAGPPGMGGTPGIYHVVGFTLEARTSHFADVGI